MTHDQNQEFYNLIWNIVNTSEFKQMYNYQHHMKTSLYDHSIKVAYLCYKHYYKYNCKTNIEELVRAALLHDYFLYDRIHKTNNCPRNRFIHLFIHPFIAYYNASTKYQLSYKEKNAIERHMFPIIPIPPTTACGWIVCWYDKVASIGDYFNQEQWKLELINDVPILFQHSSET